MIRRPELADISRLAEIHVYSWRYAYRGIVSDEELFKKRLVMNSIIRWQKTVEDRDVEAYLSEGGGIVKGFMIVCDGRDEDKKGALELASLYVEPQFMREGTGKELIDHFEKIAKERSRNEAIVWVLERNGIGRSFYEKNGYSPDGKEQELPDLEVKELRYSKKLSFR